MSQSHFIQMSRLGNYGRWANSCIQYAFLHVYARRHDATVRTSRWAGNALLIGVDDMPSIPGLPCYHERLDANQRPSPPVGPEALDLDFCGYAQFHTSWYRPDQAYVRDLLRPNEAVAERMAPAVEKLRALGETIVGLHLRRGDYGQSIFFLTPVSWYLRKLEEVWPTLKNPVLFVASEDRALVHEFQAYRPETAESLGIVLGLERLSGYAYLHEDLRNPDPVQMDFYPDFHLLQQSDVMLAPNSTYSFLAAMLAPTLEQYWRAHLPTRGFQLEDPWDARFLHHDRVGDYPDVEGVAVRQNKYWGT